ncbi:MAG: hypothetical protein ACLTWK_00770 [Eisenbergiella sp.]
MEFVIGTIIIVAFFGIQAVIVTKVSDLITDLIDLSDKDVEENRKKSA